MDQFQVLRKCWIQLLKDDVFFFFLFQQDVTEMSLPGAEDGVSNGNPDDVLPIDDAASSDIDISVADVAPTAEGPIETGEKPVIVGAPLADEEKDRRVGGHPCAQCDRVFMSMQGLRSHERSHSAMALFSREDKYSCQYCQFVSPFRHKYEKLLAQLCIIGLSGCCVFSSGLKN